MIEDDTIKLLRECDAGIKMGVSSIDEVMDYVSNKKLKDELSKCRDKHIKLQEDIEEALKEFHDEGKEPSHFAKTMSSIKTNVKLIVNESDETIVDLITDGCNMGIKSLNKYLNEYKAADERTKDITKKLIKQEEELIHGICGFL